MSVKGDANYVSSFYEDKSGSLCPITGATGELIDDVVEIYRKHSPVFDGCGVDSVDRENIREIITTILHGTKNI